MLDGRGECTGFILVVGIPLALCIMFRLIFMACYGATCTRWHCHYFLSGGCGWHDVYCGLFVCIVFVIATSRMSGGVVGVLLRVWVCIVFCFVFWACYVAMDRDILAWCLIVLGCICVIVVGNPVGVRPLKFMVKSNPVLRRYVFDALDGTEDAREVVKTVKKLYGVDGDSIVEALIDLCMEGYVAPFFEDRKVHYIKTTNKFYL